MSDNLDYPTSRIDDLHHLDNEWLLLNEDAWGRFPPQRAPFGLKCAELRAECKIGVGSAGIEPAIFAMSRRRHSP